MQTRDIVAVVDDNDTLREMICLMLEGLQIEVRGYAGARAFIDDPASRQTDCLVLDVRMPGMSGLELQHRLQDTHWQLPVLFLTAHGDVRTAVDAMRAGAVDFLLKPFQEQHLIDRVQRALDLRRRQRQSEQRRQAMRARFEVLTPREREVLGLLMNGQRTKQIANTLNLSVKTVEEHRANLMHKTHSNSMVELACMATEAALLEQAALPRG